MCEPISFDSMEEASAAVALGGIYIKCNVCLSTHDSAKLEDEELNRCVRRLKHMLIDMGSCVVFPEISAELRRTPRCFPCAVLPSLEEHREEALNIAAELCEICNKLKERDKVITMLCPDCVPEYDRMSKGELTYYVALTALKPEAFEDYVRQHWRRMHDKASELRKAELPEVEALIAQKNALVEKLI